MKKKKKVLFIDRDGTLILEPEDEQIDSLEKLEFYPTVFEGLNKIAKTLDYELVMITNQDGLGTDSFPEDTFSPAQNKMITAFKNEGINFHKIFIDKTFPNEQAPTRKPGTALLAEYFEDDYDLANSFVVGDRASDIELAKNLGAQGILLHTDTSLLNESIRATCALTTTSWNEIYDFLCLLDRQVLVNRNTKETRISIQLNIDGSGKSICESGLNFFDHMLDQLAKHSGCDLILRVEGDLHIDEHHTMEDTALALGDAFRQAIGNKLGMNRYGFCLPMDDCLAQVAIDFGGRPWLEWDASFKREKIGDVPTEMFFHFFKSFSDNARCNLNIKAEGENEHHKIEAIFKAFAKAIKAAIHRDVNDMTLPTTKGVL